MLDLGCGSGGLLTRRLAQRFRVTGVELSPRMAELARQNVPDATFIQGDMAAVAFAPESFDGVGAFYSLTHLPVAELPALLRKVTIWLKPGGLFVASLGSGDDPGSVESDWLAGAPMYFAGYPAEKNKELVESAGLHIQSARLETTEEENEPVTFLWVMARKPG